MRDTLPDTVARSTFLLRGLVQGQGVRPTIANLASDLGIRGTVRNCSRGVEIDAFAPPSSLASFAKALASTFANATLQSNTANRNCQSKPSRFRIIETLAGDRVQTTVPLDLAICQDCLAEVRSKSNRRFGYPFNTCTRCGPRYSIITAMPFDRDLTSMSAFPMCSQCEAEYRNPNDRRFHAQTISCPDCGPRCWVTDRLGNVLASGRDAVIFVAEEILAGQIAAVKGIGGYQLISDATNDDAVGRLRLRKQRPSKPLPVMVGDTDAVAAIANAREHENAALQSHVNPIVLLTSLSRRIVSPQVAGSLNTIGVMLPSSALHAMITDAVGRPIVVTSGNRHGSPIIFENSVAASDLASVADVILHHDRDILHPVDDSVVQCVDDFTMTIRGGRGITPLTFSTSDQNRILAVGGHQKLAPAIQTGESLVLLPHIGDMTTEACRIRFQESLDQCRTLYQLDFDSVTHDQHPNYFTTQWAQQNTTPAISVQHHHAHIAASMFEHNLDDQTVLGITFDGTGFGQGTIWGGEVLEATTTSYQRVAHLRPFRLPGGEFSIKQPWRIAASLNSQLPGFAPIDPCLQFAIDRGPLTSSMGRLFDAVASIVLGIDTVDFEGEAAMRLEAECDRLEAETYRFEITDNEPLQMDWGPVLRQIDEDKKLISAAKIAMRFHHAVANLIVDIAARYRDIPCVLSGGVFQNRTLLEVTSRLARQQSLDIRFPRVLPINDGGLAIGQLVVASATISRNSHSRRDTSDRLPCAPSTMGGHPCA
ncbi:carbamoyltransferase HypF [Aporhodopirellula rubra]|nr:carbamoyltransferase HypF [Aporhodopirellula rubra]